jgi:hybrid cluster-associated redox disulfide protein
MEKITKDSGIIDAVQNHPEIMEVFAKYGLGCVGCMAAQFETIGEGAGAHGIDVDALIADINSCIADTEK